MNRNRLVAYGATGVMLAEVLTGCTSSPATPADKASASAAAASSSAKEARDNEPKFSESYHPNGTRYIFIDSDYGSSTMVEFCLSATEVGIATLKADVYRSGAATTPFPDPEACADLRITREDHLPLPADLSGK